MIKPKSQTTKLFFKWFGAVGLLGLAIYPIIISPMYDSEPYKKIQSQTRVGIDQDKIQPGNIKVWSDPFDRSKPSNK